MNKLVAARQPIEICITVDTEFSIGGNFADPGLTPVSEPIVLGRVDGKEHGLGFLLDSFGEFGARATFFVEALQTAYFGDEPMGGIARRIAGAGQDVQLHLHPCWLHYETGGQTGAAALPNDCCAGRSDRELDGLFERGLASFARWGVTRPVAVRAGNFQADMGFYRAAARAAIRASSNTALAITQPIEDELCRFGGSHVVGGVREFPVLSFAYRVGPKQYLRNLAITACSTAEIRSILWQARAAGITPVVVLTHPQEFIKHADVSYARLRRNRVNQMRLTNLLRFVRDHDEDFAIVPISEISGAGGDPGGGGAPRIAVPSLTAVARMIENSVNDRVWFY